MKGPLIFSILFLSAFCGLQASECVLISQIMYDSPLNEVITKPPYSNGEFVELCNVGDASVNLQGWSLQGDGSTETFVFDDLTIPAGAFLVVAYRHFSTSDFSLYSLYGHIPHAVSGEILYQRHITLKNTGEYVRLRNAIGQTVDSVFYDGTSNKRKPDRLSADNADSIAYRQCVSLQRIKAHIDHTGKAITDNSDWVTAPVSLFANTPSVTIGVPPDFYTPDRSLSQGENYILSVTPLDATSAIDVTDTYVTTEGNVRAMVQMTSYDGLGRPYVNTLVKGSPKRTDLVSLTEYNGLENEYRRWLPIAPTGYTTTTELKSQLQTYYMDHCPYEEIRYEASELNRVLGRTQAGKDWQEYPSQMTYDNETEGTIKHYSAIGNNLQCHRTYDACQLYRTIYTDEDGKMVEEFTNKSKQLILRRENGNVDTYYVYDMLGRLRFILPPAIANAFSMGSYNETNERLQRYAYIYHYDSRGNLIYKRFPGCEPIYMVYDAGNRLVKSQDGNQRARGRYWTVSKYDAQGRAAYTAEVKTEADSLEEDIEQFSHWTVVETFSTETQKYPMENTGYSRNFYHRHPTKLLTVNYYDNYDFLQLLPSDTCQALAYTEQQGYGTRYENATGLLTGTRVYNLQDNSYNVSAYYYDANGRVIQQRSTSGMGGYDILYTAYNFDGTTAQMLHEQGKVSEHYVYAYDHTGRLLQTTYQVADMPAVVLSQKTYDDCGRLIGNVRHNGTDVETYAYDLRGKLTHIQSGDFSERLYYADSLPMFASPHYNGNISLCAIQHKGEQYVYTYSYDGLNRLTASNVVLSDEPQPSEVFTYDDMGNILTLQRYCYADTYNNGVLVDDLSFTYSGNQVTDICDYADPMDYYDLHDYENKSYIDEERPLFCYDANGNLLGDFDRNICTIRYNLLNLPDTMQFRWGNQLRNRYDAVGTKQQTSYLTPGEPEFLPMGSMLSATSLRAKADEEIVMYDGNMECTLYHTCGTPDTLQCSLVVYNPEGYTRFVPDSMGQLWSKMYYYRRDHLGSNVAVWDAAADSTVQRTLYYASGLPMRKSQGQMFQTRKYNGKEYREMYGLNEYDYGFRGYYATIARFTTKDPLGELTPWQSPYTYAKNNSITNIDYKGLMYMHHSNGGSWLSLKDNEPVRSYTEVDMEGVVTKHIDDENDKRVMIVHEDGNKYEIGSEWDGERYKVGNRAYFMSRHGGVRMYYSYSRGIYVTPKTEFDVRIGRWLRAKDMDTMEEALLEKERPFVQGVVLLNPLLGTYNDVKTLLTGSNIYGTPADAADYTLSIISLFSGGASNLLSDSIYKRLLTRIGQGSTIMSGLKTIYDGYTKEDDLQENY